jgi:hypothetical protein
MGKVWDIALRRGPRRVEKPKQPERRQSPRYPTVMNRTFIGWWVDGKFEHTLARIDNISVGGAMAVVQDTPPVQDVMVRVEVPAVIDWLPMSVVWTNGYQVGLSFPDGCPFTLFKAIRGFTDIPEVTSSGPEFDSRLWR